MGPAGSSRLRARGNSRNLSSPNAPKIRDGFKQCSGGPKGAQSAFADAPKFRRVFGCSSRHA
eukprot:7510300-Alexandrium_andersonii.AAC.1